MAWKGKVTSTTLSDIGVKSSKYAKKQSLASFIGELDTLLNDETRRALMLRIVRDADNELKKKLESLNIKDTGLMQESWRIPLKYLENNRSKTWKIYCENTATVEQQAKRKGTSLTKRGLARNSYYHLSFGMKHPRTNYAKWVFSEKNPSHLQDYNNAIRVTKQLLPRICHHYLSKWADFQISKGYTR